MERFERLQKARKAAGFETATEAARKFGWNENNYRSHENGQRGISREGQKYADAFDVRIEWLMYGREPMREGEETPADELAEKIRRLDPKIRRSIEAAIDAGQADKP